MDRSGHLSQTHMIGRIHSVYCKDFVSYNEITYFPKEYLNVLTGPNGTGKSTIVSAIILGLGGDPQLLDRSSSIADYIKSNKSSAIITITINGRSKNSKESFKRTINQNGQSHFYVNSKELSKTKFLDIVASFNIQVSNLCQFLPQDRVQDFSKMNPQELLVNTMSSVCDDEFIKNFNDLKEMKLKLLNAHADREKDKENLQKEQKRLEQLQVTVDQYQERQEILQKVNVHKAKKLWSEITVANSRIDELKSSLNKANKECQTRKKTYELQKRAQQEITQKSFDLRQKKEEQIKLISHANNAKNKLDSLLEAVKHKVNERNFELKRHIEQANKNKMEADNLKQAAEGKNQELQQFYKYKSDLVNELEEHGKIINQTRETTMRQYNRRREIEAKLNDEKIPEVTALKHKIERLQNIKTQKIEELRNQNPNLIKAMSWVAENKHKYKSNIYDPMIFELNIKSPDAAMCLENLIRQRDLFAFACEDKNDMSDLINELCVKQKLSVNIIYCAPGNRCLYTSTVPLSEITSIGFTSYLVDLVSGPMPIINKLCGTYQIHNIPIGTEEVSNNTSIIPKSIRVFFGGTKKFLVTASRYRSDLILTESTIQRKNQLITLDSKQLAALQDRYNNSISERNQLRNKLVEVDNEFERLQATTKEEVEKKRKIEQKLNYFENLENEVKKLNDKILNINRSFNSLDDVEKTFQKNVLSDFKQLFEIEQNLLKILETCEKNIALKKVFQLMESVHIRQHESQMNTLNESEENYKGACGNVEKITKSLETHTESIQSKTEELQSLCNGKLPSSKDFPFKSEFRDLSKLHIEQIHEAIVEFQARLECMANVNPQAIADFQQRQEQVKLLKQIIDQKTNQEKNVDGQITALFNNWEPKLNNLIETISAKFSEFMESMSYIGEVVLSRNDKHDFKSYGIQIMVQYRKEGKLQTLDKYIQSGGERAVAIAIYSMSLQHVTSVPFRCVDEINQGMDATNERNIFELLLREATKEGSAQYLFVTPKLLPDLNYNDHLCVSVVYNSASMKPGANFPRC
ncbi:structural maintenance of chromosomes protein 5 [Drosophila nasuta]|uniref:structural maintenance of chromosomes protein 5 n=1 Tax=Drosophila nasuta TaxID=42062 RepID=UPI00295EC67B|nr:structural maintenance of chromosomes protein 5 [Drosophila nasuta]